MPFKFQKKQSNQFTDKEFVFVYCSKNLNLKISQTGKLAVQVNKKTSQQKLLNIQLQDYIFDKSRACILEKDYWPSKWQALLTTGTKLCIYMPN